MALSGCGSWPATSSLTTKRYRDEVLFIRRIFKGQPHKRVTDGEPLIEGVNSVTVY